MAPKQVREVVDLRLRIGGLDVNLRRRRPGGCGIRLKVASAQEHRHWVGLGLPENVERREPEG